MMPIGSIAMIGFCQICRAKGIEMNPMAIPASVESSAARGVRWRIFSATNDPKNSINPLPKQAISPICQASSAFWVLSYTGRITKKT